MRLKRGSTLFLKVVICLIGIGTLVVLIWFPQLEGRAANLDLIHIYSDPAIIYAYIGSIPFFVALYQAFKLLGYIEQDQVFSEKAVRALRKIKLCAVAIIGFIVAGIAFIILGSEEDPAGVVAMGIYTTFATVVIAVAAAVFERLLQNAVDIKSENDLTV
ncbi:MAG TPA: DUF2975 domain-containing protein [Chloroflexota bacterium]|nr:DUF2975 domain-containing protein [Chloroflexota bacterium]HUM69292.1 DUF2975 domain-containing protein [Chloroflexota bacterium]